MTKREKEELASQSDSQVPKLGTLSYHHLCGVVHSGHAGCSWVNLSDVW